MGDSQGTLDMLTSDLERVWNSEYFCPMKERREEFRDIHKRCWTQICRSEGFDIDEFPLGCLRTQYAPLLDFEEVEGDKLVKMANHAILEYNDKESSVFKYEFLKIEKVTFLGDAERQTQYLMTVKVRNLTLRTIETFQITGAIKYCYPPEFIISLCRPKKEV
ncbi:PREDICTED: uncharacterized protein LOC109236761 [Nicotiana attenuata]|uniref:Cystatin domain-containing protein n=1 Tax=Nicotiana attenuata TaxID=49451 RepID=A0A314LIQ9_NICAT|nr:PREDICTED: uncharacterized protein LOC109236761 [Nicotiana attenuata]OIT40474.1 hypothetical protein A4A49_06992 [Nicotiana attenuata]